MISYELVFMKSGKWGVGKGKGTKFLYSTTDTHVPDQ